jgi:ribonuclease HI
MKHRTLGLVKRKHVYIYTDGSCNTTTGDGGWAYLLVYGKAKKEASGHEANTTNNRMELTAAVKALEALKEPCNVTLTTDSQYLRKAFTEGWLNTWQRNGWKTANKDAVKNQDLWEELLELSSKHTLTWEWTEGHAGHPENERVDKLALKARRQGLMPS